MDEVEQLRNIVRWRTKHKFDRTARLGDVLSKLMDNRISPQQARFGSVAEIWSQLLPAELLEHCKITDVTGGRLKVLVDSPSYMYELQLCSSELLSELQMHCSRAGIKKIKFVVE